MKAQLDRAYELIRAGQNEEAISILEDIIRDYPDNEDVWWLLANGTNDVETKRKALNEVIRLSSNAQRRNQAQEILAQVDADPYSFNSNSNNYRGMPAYQGQIQKQNRGCGRNLLIGIAIFGVLTCIACFAFYSYTLPYLSLPDDYENMGVLVENQTFEGTVDGQESDGYSYQGEAGQRIKVSVYNASSSEIPPIIFLFDSRGLPVTISQDISTYSASFTETLAYDDSYTIIVRPLFGMGGGDYSIELEILN